MPLHAQERVLLIGDNDRQLHAALLQVMPGATVTAVPGYFDGIAELSSNHYTAVFAAAEPIERRPEAAVRTLRHLVGDGRLLLFGHPTLEPLSRKMLEFGCDDYLVSPAAPGELLQVFGTPTLRLASQSAGVEPSPLQAPVAAEPSKMSVLMGLSLSEILLDAMLKHTHDAPAAAIKQLNTALQPTMHLIQSPEGAPAPSAPDGWLTLSVAVRGESTALGALHLLMPRDEEESAARHFLSQLAHLLGKLMQLQDRHNQLQKLAITDELTGLYNARYFKHFLSRILEKARAKRFPVTLLLFDIDNFKRYNDTYGHGVGDEILKQTAMLLKRCCRDHDLVARISGDEYAVVFWEKEGPRQPRQAAQAPNASRLPSSLVPILERFRRLISSHDFPELGASGKGTLTISGGLAVFPYDAHNMESLIQAADHALMFGAKQQGKNCINLVGDSAGSNLGGATPSEP